ncbi:MAG: co-chaperone GroES [Candidatus Sericytochromatia bacterium]|nr:co-chaperone GroES [Candidatus Sericytochromatia bacterium]
MSTATKTLLRPLGERVVVKLVQAEEKTRGGIMLPDTAKEKPQEAEVLAVGPGKLLDSGARSPIELKAGDHILFAKYSGTEVKLEGEEYLVIAEKDILAVIER